MEWRLSITAWSQGCGDLNREVLEDVPEYNPNQLQLLTRGADSGDTLRKYSSLMAKILGLEEIAREDVENFVKEIFRLPPQEIPKAYNDMRRLGVVTIGSGGSWIGRAKLTPLGEYLKKCLHHGGDATAALAIVLCAVRDWGLLEEEAGFCHSLRRGAQLDKAHCRLVEKAVEIVTEHAAFDCIPYGADFAALKEVLQRCSQTSGVPRP